MNKMNIEVKEQLLKDLAANVGYDLIPAPFNTPFEEASIEGLPDSKQFFWPVPSSVLNDKEHEVLIRFAPPHFRGLLTRMPMLPSS